MCQLLTLRHLASRTMERNACSLSHKPDTLVVSAQGLRQGQQRESREASRRHLTKALFCLLTHILFCHLGEVFKDYTTSTANYII